MIDEDHRSRLLPWLPALALFAAAAPAAATLQPAGTLQTLNESAPCSQHQPHVAPLAGGGFVAVWRGEVAGGFGIAARLLDEDGAPLGGELTLAVGPEEPILTLPRVAPGADGGFVVAWVELDDVALENRVMLRGFDADGTPRGPAVLVAIASPEYSVGLALATDPAGRPAVAWTNEAFVWLRLYDADLTPRTGRVEVALGGNDPSLVAGVPAVTIHPDPLADLLVVWSEAPVPPPSFPVPGPPLSFDRVRGRLFDREDGEPRGEPFVVHQGADSALRFLAPDAAALPGVGFVVTWAGLIPAGEADPAVQARLLDGLGGPLGETFEVEGVYSRDVFDPDVAVLADGSFAITWWAWVLPPPVTPLPPGFDELHLAWIRRFDRFGAPLGGALPLMEPPDFLHWTSVPAVAAAPGGDRLVAVWRYHYAFPPIPPPPCAEQAEIRARAFTAGCIGSAERLCLQDGRFSVEVLLTDPRLGPPIPRLAAAEPLAGDTGTFWFFRPDNVELMVKLLDGRSVNGRWWFFSGALTDVGHEIVVTDRLTGEERRYVNPPGELESRADTTAFEDPVPPPGAPAVGTLTAAEIDPGASAPLPLAGAGELPPPCEDPDALCLHGGIVRVRLDWIDPRSGDSGTATPVPLSNEAGWFWFFRPGNAEAVVKVHDGWPVNDRYWVFFGGLTDLELTLTVENVLAGVGKTYHNPPFTLTSFADTAALPLPFPCPVCGTAAPAPATRSAGGP